MPEETQEQGNSRPGIYRKGQFVKGQSGNPGGRKKGSKSLKQWVKEKMEAMSDEEREDFMEGLPKEIIWKMSEGMPQTNTDVTSGGKPIPLFGNVPDNNSNKQDTRTE